MILAKGWEGKGRERGRPALPVVQEDNPGTGTSTLCYPTSQVKTEKEGRKGRKGRGREREGGRGR